MKLTDVTIRNFRSINDLSFKLHPFTTFIGKNNSGKSSAIKAISLALSDQKPELADWPKQDTSNPIEVELTFEDLTDWEKTRPGVSGVVFSNKIKLKYSAFYDDGPKPKISTSYHCKKRPESITGWNEKFNDLSDEIKAIAAPLNLTATEFKRASEKEKLKQAIREQKPTLIVHGEEDWTEDGISINAALQQALPLPIEIPAILDLTEEAKAAAKTAFGRLVNSILLPALQSTNEYKELTEAVAKLQAKMSSATDKLDQVKQIENLLSESIAAVMPAKVTLEMDSPDFNKLISTSPILKIDDGAKTAIQNQGHGLQRSVIFSIIETIGSLSTRIPNQDGSSNQRARILLFEEPELFLHPHLMRRMRDSLKKISALDQYQVVLSTHSPVFIDVADNPKSLIIFKKDNHASVKQIENDPFAGAANEDRVTLRATLTFHPTVCEVFFANKTILVEGDSELAVLNHSYEFLSKYGVTQEKFRETTIISCAGKWTIIPVAKLLKAFAIDFKIVHDIDAKGRTPEELAAVRGNDPYAANAKIAEQATALNIYKVDDTFENLLPINRAAKDKPFQCWKEAQKLINSETERNALVPLKNLIEFVYN